MKKIVILSLFLLILTVSIFAAGTSRTYSQKVKANDPAVDLLTLVTSTASTYTAPNYVIDAYMTERPAEHLTTGVTPVASLKLNKAGNGTTIPFYGQITMQLGTFTTQWAEGNHLNVTVTKTDVAAPNSTSWVMVVPAGTNTISFTNFPAVVADYQDVPPIYVAPQTTLVAATLVAPLMDAVAVPLGSVHMDWDYPTGALITPATGYNVRFATTAVALETAPITNHVDSFFDVFFDVPLQNVYWQVQPVGGTKAVLPWGDAPVWHFQMEDQGPVGYDVQVNCNIPGATIYQDGIAVGVAPHLFTGVVGTVSWSVMNIATQVTPAPQGTTAAATLQFNYTDPLNTVGGDGGSTVAASAGPIVVPAVAGVEVTGTVNAPGLIVVTQVTPTAKTGTYHGYLNVENIYQVWVSDTAILNGGVLNFGIGASYKYVAIHWGGANNGWYPVNNPEDAGVPTPGYYFNGGIGWNAPYDFPLGMAPFSGAAFAAGTLTLGVIPAYMAKGDGTFEVVLGTDVDLPVELSSFAAVTTAQMFVNLLWTTESETNNLGFNVYRSEDNNVNNAIQVNLNIIPGTNQSTTHNYTFEDRSVDPETTYYYWLEMVENNNFSTFSNVVTVTTNPQTPVVPIANATVLRSAYPNPFSVRTSTNIAFDVKTGEKANLSIYNVLGQVVKTYSLNDGPNQLVQWNGKDDNGAVCGSGIYFYKLTSPSNNTTKKMVIVK